jgi:AGCS family alanine or glycine:cation symporter
MATKYAEAVLAVRFREVDERGKHVGGPMYYIRNGLGRHWQWLGAAFALFGMLAAFGIGNMVQSNTLADELQNNLAVPTWISGLVIALLIGAVILGGITRIAEVVEKLVPFMAVVYVAGALLILLLHLEGIPAALGLIVSDAFTGTAASGGFAGATVWMALRWGFARGIFSNEAGLGSAPIAHAAARTTSPVRQGMVAMLGTFIDTLVVCTMTALVIIVTGVWDSGVQGAPMSSLAFDTGLPGPGGYIVTFGLVVFAFTTMLGWSYYGERCGEYLFGVRIIFPYRLLWVIAIYTGANVKLNFVWMLADALNGLMALPNLVALLLLSPVVFGITREYLADQRGARRP